MDIQSAFDSHIESIRQTVFLRIGGGNGASAMLLIAIGLFVISADSFSVAAESQANELSHAPAVPEATKSYVLLQNGNVFSGSVTRLGKSIRLTRTSGSTIQLDTQDVIATVDSLDKLIAFRRAGRDPSDLVRIQKDVRWFLRQKLVHAAAEDVLTARAIDPTDRVTVQLLSTVAHQLRRALQTVSEPRKPSATTVSHSEASQEDSLAEGVSGEIEKENPEFEEGWLNHFRTRVQPILMNRCAGCHSRLDGLEENEGSGFQLHSSLSSRMATRSVAKENLRSVSRYIDTSQPMNSKLREKAIDDHGGRRFSLRTGSDVMIRTLDHWLLQVPREAGNQQAGDQPSHASEDQSGLARTNALPHLMPIGDGFPLAGEQDPESPSSPVARASWDEEGSAALGVDLPTSQQRNLKTRRMPKVKNPFDPELFNRRFHGPG